MGDMIIMGSYPRPSTGSLFPGRSEWLPIQPSKGPLHLPGKGRKLEGWQRPHSAPNQTPRKFISPSSSFHLGGVQGLGVMTRWPSQAGGFGSGGPRQGGAQAQAQWCTLQPWSAVWVGFDWVTDDALGASVWILLMGNPPSNFRKFTAVVGGQVMQTCIN